MTRVPRTYLVWPRWNMIVAALPALAAAVTLAVTAIAAAAGASTFLQRYWIVLAGALVFSLFSLRPYLALAHRIVVSENAVVFHGLGGERTVRSGRAISLRPAPLVPNAFQLVYEDGRVAFASRFTGFHEVVAALRAQSPGLIIEGC